MHDVFPVERPRAHAGGHHHADAPGECSPAQPNAPETTGDFPSSPSHHRAGVGHRSQPAPERSQHALPEIAARDSEVALPVASRETSEFRPLKTFTLALIRFYQICLSPSIPSSCRFYPSCSGYAYDAISKWGVRKGIAMAMRRLLRCHPFGKSGYDPVP